MGATGIGFHGAKYRVAVERPEKRASEPAVRERVEKRMTHQYEAGRDRGADDGQSKERCRCSDCGTQEE